MLEILWSQFLKELCMQQICMLHKMWDYAVAHLKLRLQFGTIRQISLNFDEIK